MKFLPASTPSVVAFVLIVAAVIAAFLIGIRYAYRTEPARAWSMTFRVAAAVALWLGFLSWLVASDRLQKLPLSGLPFFFGSVAAISLAVGFSPLGGRLAAN